ncbi:MAG: DUF1653 domain-containing protein [Sulfuricurvum sp.]|nr:DUF1653 domain-containing protein [Sulfuricurvum sp.]MDD5386191.1 DUF1653 domain-containing protein [Sulfuricurvum sp.]
MLKEGKYLHYKGNEYDVMGVAKHSETEELLVVYRALYGERGLWIRPLEMFDGVLDDGTKRFVYVGDSHGEG